ncbi:TIGR04282 family arsenosugar biosynthesis glycosyltransferase [Microtetraspora glauca]|uniref:TIGR04282 family arsenosugar biosynthesis glycosyltransferase n=1 Tax=Microtetraspora glauca TaxID=1996 RepID=A0ABV3GU55_MICGL
MIDAQIVVIAKEPVAGRVKTRLTPPFTPGQAARLAAAALEDTLLAVTEAPVRYRVLALEGLPGSWLPAGVEVIPQRGAGLDERIAYAITDAHRLHPVPTVLIGMDTPQVTSALLCSAADALADHDAVYGPAADGGFWLLGLVRPDMSVVAGVPMSRPDTGDVLLWRLRNSGLRVAVLPELLDVDTAADAARVAAGSPHSRLAASLAAMPGLAETSAVR